jgi:hypothetical protein
MLGKELANYIKAEEELLPYFKGIYAINQLPSRIPKHCFIVVNKDKINQAGSHWFAIGQFSDEHEVFDSLGANETFLYENLRNLRFNHLNYNTIQYQPNDSLNCSKYVLYWLISRVLNPDLTFENLLEEIFSDDPIKNEQIVNNYFTKKEFYEK